MQSTRRQPASAYWLLSLSSASDCVWCNHNSLSVYVCLSHSHKHTHVDSDRTCCSGHKKAPAIQCNGTDGRTTFSLLLSLYLSMFALQWQHPPQQTIQDSTSRQCKQLKQKHMHKYTQTRTHCSTCLLTYRTRRHLPNKLTRSTNNRSWNGHSFKERWDKRAE